MRTLFCFATCISTLFFLSSCAPDESSRALMRNRTKSKNPPDDSDGMQWSLVDPKVPVLSEPVFDGKNWIALGFQKQATAAGFSGYTDGTSDAYIYESSDGVSWQNTSSLKSYGFRGARKRLGKNDENDLVVLGEQTYLRQEEPWVGPGLPRKTKILKRIARGDWRASTTLQPSPEHFMLVGPAHGGSEPFYATAADGGYLYRSLHVAYADRIPLNYVDSDASFKTLFMGHFLSSSVHHSHFYVFNNKVFRLLLGEADTEKGQNRRAMLFQADVGAPDFHLVKRFPSFIEPAGGVLAKDQARFSMASNEKDAYILGLGSVFSREDDLDTFGYGPRFYKSSDAENWTEILESDVLARFSAQISLKKESTDSVYELGGVAYSHGLFVLFVVERSYAPSSFQRLDATTPQRDIQSAACHIITSKDLVKFYAQTFPKINCERAQAFYHKGKYVFTVKLEDGRAVRGGKVAEQTFRLGIITATP